MNNHAIFEEIDGFFRSYRDTFEQLEPHAITPFWVAPTLSIESSRIRICADDQALLAAFQDATDDLRGAGMRTADFVLEEVRVLRNDLIDCVVHWCLRNSSGATIKVLQNVYVLRCLDKGWGIAAVYLLPADQHLTRLANVRTNRLLPGSAP